MGSSATSSSRGSTTSSNSRGSAMSSKSRGSAMSSDFETIPIIEDDFEEDNHNTFVHHANMNHGFGGSSNTRKSVNKFASDSFGSSNEDRFTGSSGFMNSHKLGPQEDNSMRVNIQPNFGGYRNGGGSQRYSGGASNYHASSTGKSSSAYY